MKIVNKTKIWVSISLLIIIAGFLVVMIYGPSYGVDFTGGTLIHINIGKDFSASDIREIINKNDIEADVMKAGQDKQQVIIKMKSMENENEIRKDLIDDIVEKYDLSIDEDLLGTEKVGASVGKELTQKALQSILIACIGMLIYIWYRFELISGIAAILALLHDVLVIFAVTNLLKVQINSSFVAALLTIIGYSINDTIVIFDRIRENAKIMKKQSFSDIVDISVSQSLQRTINTSLTTLFTITALYVLGVPSIKDFALPLIVGIVAGTYSSIFIAGPIWALWNDRSKRKKAYSR